MHGKLAGWDDTITAVATAPGIGAIAVIRVSGKETLAIADKIFAGKKISEQPTHTLHVGMLKHNDAVIDEVVLSLFKTPRSYTGEDVIEISCHGSPYIQQQILDAIAASGARLAKPGEFTQRAFLNGKLDLVQAEAVADLIASNTEASKNAALKTMRGGFSHALKAIREQMLTFSALLELELDFSQEDVAFADRTAFIQLLNKAEETVGLLIQSFKLGNVIKNGVQVAIIGKPNSGKSTLLNSLLNDERAIVSEIAGTTRDTVEEILNINGILFRLIDTAGIRKSIDTIEAIGVEKSFEKMETADIVVYLFDVNTESPEELQQAVEMVNNKNNNFILAGNKTDINGETYAITKYNDANIVFIAAKNNTHVDKLKLALVNKIMQGNINTESTLVTNARHLNALIKVQESIEEIKTGMHEKVPGDLLALDVRNCLHYLGEITGEITNEDQLDYIFGKFCIGK